MSMPMSLRVDIEIGVEEPVVDMSVLYVDGGQNRQTGVNAWGCVVDAKGIDVLEPHRRLLDDMELISVMLPKNIGRRTVIVAHFQKVKQQNNGAELLAFVAALRLAIYYYPKYKVIASDSKLIVDYWSKYLSQEKELCMDKRKALYIWEAIQLRQQYEELGGELLKIKGDYNPADLGYHRS